MQGHSPLLKYTWKKPHNTFIQLAELFYS